MKFSHWWNVFSYHVNGAQIFARVCYTDNIANHFTLVEAAGSWEWVNNKLVYIIGNR